MASRSCEVVFEAERVQDAVGEIELFATGRGLTGRPRGGEVRIRIAQLPPAGGHARPLFEQRRIGDPSLHHPHAQADVGRRRAAQRGGPLYSVLGEDLDGDLGEAVALTAAGLLARSALPAQAGVAAATVTSAGLSAWRHWRRRWQA